VTRYRVGRTSGQLFSPDRLASRRRVYHKHPLVESTLFQENPVLLPWRLTVLLTLMNFVVSKLQFRCFDRLFYGGLAYVQTFITSSALSFRGERNHKPLNSLLSHTKIHEGIYRVDRRASCFLRVD